MQVEFVHSNPRQGRVERRPEITELKSSRGQAFREVYRFGYIPRGIGKKTLQTLVNALLATDPPILYHSKITPQSAGILVEIRRQDLRTGKDILITDFLVRGRDSSETIKKILREAICADGERLLRLSTAIMSWAFGPKKTIT